MGTIHTRHGVRGNTFRAEIKMNRLDGTLAYMTKSFKEKPLAANWIKVEEGKIASGGDAPASTNGVHTVRAAFELYLKTVAKRPCVERTLINRWLTQEGTCKFVERPIGAVTTPDIIDWRDERLQAIVMSKDDPTEVKTIEPSTVRREWNVLAGVFTHFCDLEWLAKSPMPVKVRGSKKDHRPKDNKPRRRGFKQEELGMIYAAAELGEGAPIESHTHRAALAFELAIETTCRIGELVRLELHSAAMGIDLINWEKRTALLPKTKNGDERSIALSTRAVAIIKRLLAGSPDANRPLPMDAKYLSKLGTNLRRKAGLKGLRTHDTRREACQRMAKLPGMTIQSLSQQTGHRDLRMLMVYFDESAADRAKLLP